MRKPCSVIGCFLVIVPLLTGTLQCQVAGQQEKSDSLKIRATEVFVDAVVSDRKNRLIGDLGQQDFQIYEDGVRQEITSFRVVRGAAKTAPQPASEKKSTDTRAAAESKSVASEYIPPNITIVLLDYSTTRFE